MRKVFGALASILFLTSCVNAERNSAEVEEFDSVDMIGSWVQTEPPNGNDDITANIIRFRLFEDSTAEIQYGESEELKKGKWGMNPKMEVGNKMFGISFEADLMLTFQSSNTTLANIAFNVREESGNFILEAGAKSAVYQKEE